MVIYCVAIHLKIAANLLYKHEISHFTSELYLDANRNVLYLILFNCILTVTGFFILYSMPEEELLIMPHQTSNTSSSDKTSEERKFVWSPVPVNTHLMCHQNHGLIRHSSMADLRLTEEQVKRRKSVLSNCWISKHDDTFFS